jgi:hypothetical protein
VNQPDREKKIEIRFEEIARPGHPQRLRRREEKNSYCGSP